MKLSINPSSKHSIISEQQFAANITTHDYLAVASGYSIKKDIQDSKSSEEKLHKCSIYIDLLNRKYPHIPESCSFIILENKHTFGTNYKVAISYKMANAKAVVYANTAECGAEDWDCIAIQELETLKDKFYSNPILQRA